MKSTVKEVKKNNLFILGKLNVFEAAISYLNNLLPTFCIMDQQLNLFSKSKSLNEGESKLLCKLNKLDPKPSELTMSRLKRSVEGYMEDRTYVCGNRRGELVVRDERSIKLGDSWFSTKAM